MGLFQRSLLARFFLRALLALPVGAPAEEVIHFDQNIDFMLDQIDREEFYLSISGPVGGDPDGLDSQARMTPEVKYLLDHADQAIPKMLERQSVKGTRFSAHTRILYFIIFKHAKDARALPMIADYFDSLPASDEQQAVPESGIIPAEHCGEGCLDKLNKQLDERRKDWDPNVDAYQYAVFAAYAFLPPPPAPKDPYTRKQEAEFALNFFRSRHQLAEQLRAEFKRRSESEKK